MNREASTITDELLFEALNKTVDDTDYGWLGTKQAGKVRDNYLTQDARRFMITTDRVSAFDRILGTIPLKGQVLHGLAAWWFDKSKDIVPNHVVRNVDPNVLEVIDCDPLPVEMVVRAYLTGVTSTSIWTHYARGERVFCGNPLPDGMTQHQRLPEAILTPSTKAEHGGHDVSASREQILAMGQISTQDFDMAADLAMTLFAYGQKVAAERGLILVDTKYEFGKRPDGTIIVIDEVHTPDSSRYWYADSYERARREGKAPASFDKEYVRRWLASEGFTGDGDVPEVPAEVKVEAARRYIEIYEVMTGSRFVPNTEEPVDRMERAIRQVL